jgi:hypothetical protein
VFFVIGFRMTNGRQTIVALVLGLSLAACGTTSAPTPVAAPSPPVPIDGTYGGVMQLIRGSAMNCGDQVDFTLRIVNHAFTFKLPQPTAEWKPVIVFTANVGSDGSFNVMSGPDYMRGGIAGGVMHGEISGDICGFTFNASRGTVY